MYVMGVDTRTHAMHVAASFPIPLFWADGISDKQASWKVGWSEWDGTADEDRERLFLSSRALFRRLPPGAHVFCEEPLCLKNGATTRKLCMAAGAVWLGFREANPDAWWYWVDPASWKKPVLGRGAPPKDFVGHSKATRTKDWIAAELATQDRFTQWVAEHADPLAFASQPDLYDAWCLMTYGVQSLSARPMSPNKEKASSDSERSS